MPARGVTAGRDSRRVDLLDPGEVVDCGGDVFEGPRPASALLADAAKLDVPGSDAAPGEIVSEWGHQRPVPAAAPEAAVDEHDAGPRSSLAGGQVEVRDGVWVVAVREARRRWRLVLNRHKGCQASSARFRVSAATSAPTSRERTHTSGPRPADSRGVTRIGNSLRTASPTRATEGAWLTWRSYRAGARRNRGVDGGSERRSPPLRPRSTQPPRNVIVLKLTILPAPS